MNENELVSKVIDYAKRYRLKPTLSKKRSICFGIFMADNMDSHRLEGYLDGLIEADNKHGMSGSMFQLILERAIYNIQNGTTV